MAKKDGYTTDQLARMDKGESLIPENVRGVWIGKERLLHIRDLLHDNKVVEAIGSIEDLLFIKKARSKRQRPTLWVQFSTADGTVVMRGPTTGYNENGLGARVEIFTQTEQADTKRSKLVGQPGAAYFYCPPGEFYPSPFTCTLLRVEPPKTRQYHAFIALEFDTALSTEFLQSLEQWGHEIRQYCDAQTQICNEDAYKLPEK